jgi:5-amino-6-(5-phosphoribosylamino)uracil reductase
VFQSQELPFVLTNGAVSADGKLAFENRSLIQFSSARDRHYVFELRAEADAILCGAETVETFAIDLAAGPAACRKKRQRLGLPPEPLRILVSQDGNIERSARIFKKPVSPIIVLTTTGAASKCARTLGDLAVVKGFGKNSVSFPQAFRWLRNKYGVKRLLCEGGGETNAALIRAGVVDEIHITICPLILCGRDAPTICDGQGFSSLRQVARLKLKSVKEHKGELFLTYQVLPKRKRP